MFKSLKANLLLYRPLIRWNFALPILIYFPQILRYLDPILMPLVMSIIFGFLLSERLDRDLVSKPFSVLLPNQHKITALATLIRIALINFICFLFFHSLYPDKIGFGLFLTTLVVSVTFSMLIETVMRLTSTTFGIIIVLIAVLGLRFSPHSDQAVSSILTNEPQLCFFFGSLLIILTFVALSSRQVTRKACTNQPSPDFSGGIRTMSQRQNVRGQQNKPIAAKILEKIGIHHIGKPGTIVRFFLGELYANIGRKRWLHGLVFLFCLVGGLYLTSLFSHAFQEINTVNDPLYVVLDEGFVLNEVFTCFHFFILILLLSLLVSDGTIKTNSGLLLPFGRNQMRITVFALSVSGMLVLEGVLCGSVLWWNQLVNDSSFATMKQTLSFYPASWDTWRFLPLAIPFATLNSLWNNPQRDNAVYSILGIAFLGGLVATLGYSIGVFYCAILILGIWFAYWVILGRHYERTPLYQKN